MKTEAEEQQEFLDKLLDSQLEDLNHNEDWWDAREVLDDDLKTNQQVLRECNNCGYSGPEATKHKALFSREAVYLCARCEDRAEQAKDALYNKQKYGEPRDNWLGLRRPLEKDELVREA